MKKTPKPPVQVDNETIARAISAGDDFGHEMRIKTVLIRGAKVQHGWSYLDPIEAKPRQFDLRARMEHPELPRRFSLAVEGKNFTPEAPLVISGTARTREEAFHHFVLAQTERGSRKIMNSWRDQPFYPLGGFVGRSMQRYKKDQERGILVPMGDGDAHKAWTQAMASADELCKEAIATTHPMKLQISTVILPMVVVPDGALWMVEYMEDGTLKAPPAPCDDTTLFLNHEVVVVPHNHWIRLGHVHFMTLKGLSAFMDALTAKHASWEEWFPASAEQYAPPVQ